jgi:copper resistance protein D
LEQLLDLYGFVSVVLHAAELGARTALLGGVAFWALLLPALAPRLPGLLIGVLLLVHREA